MIKNLRQPLRKFQRVTRFGVLLAVVMFLQAIFAFYTFIIAVGFFHSGVRVIKLLTMTGEFRDALIKSSIATVLSTLSLIVTVAISLYSVNNTLDSMLLGSNLLLT